MSNIARRSDCPINFVLELFGDRWTFLIVRDMMFKGKHSYGEFLHSEEGIATNILADRLSMLEQTGVVIKTSDPSHGSKFIYTLTKKGIDLAPLLVEAIMWSAKYDKKTAADPQFVRQVKKDRSKVLKETTDSLIARLQNVKV
jgi:DNA-binding HxlR family transcriptional regulator